MENIIFDPITKLSSQSISDSDPPSIPPIQIMKVNYFKNFSIEKKAPSFKSNLLHLMTLENHEGKKVLKSEESHDYPLFRKQNNKRKKIEIESRFQEDERKKMNSQFFKVLMRFYLVKKFVKRLRENSNIYAISMLKNQHYTLLNDFTF